MKKIILALLVAVSGTGCETFTTSRYSVSVDNIQALKEFKGSQVKVGNFSSVVPGLSTTPCGRLGPIKTPDGEPYAEYIRKALVDELKISEIYSNDASVTLTGQLNTLDFSSKRGNWNISLTVASTNGRTLTVNENYKYATSFLGETAFNQTAQALMPAVQDLIGKLVRGSEFKSLLNTSASIK